MNSKFCSTSDLPQVLADEQVEFYQQQGYLILRNVFTSEEIEQLSQDVDRVQREHADLMDPKNMRARFKPHYETGEATFEVFDPFADLSPVAAGIARDPRLLAPLHDLYGEPAELFKEKLIYKLPGAEGATLHQDWISWPEFPKSFLTVLVAIDPFTATSGATEVFPGQHRQGYLSPEDGQHHTLDERQFLVEPVPLLLEPGDVAIFTCFLPHRSAPNTSDSARRGYFISYNAHSEGGAQYEKHYREFHEWILSKVSPDVRELLYFR